LALVSTVGKNIEARVLAHSLVVFALFVYWRGPVMLLWTLRLLAANFCYNQPPLASKNRPVFDLLNQATFWSWFWPACFAQCRNSLRRR